jgi:hypothetical protein
MMQHHRPHPDFLRRFVPTPYIFNVSKGKQCACVQSNNLEVALSVRRSYMLQPSEAWGTVLLCKLIRDVAAPGGGSEVSVVESGPLRVLHMGRGTILVYDRARSELFGFLSHEVDTVQLVTSLIPTVVGYETAKSGTSNT